MPRNVIIAPGEYYHIYNRGTEKRVIFSSSKDYERFLCLLFLCNSKHSVEVRRQGRTLAEAVKIDRGQPLVDVCAYCLMPNHFHLLVREVEKDGISRFMQKLTTGYTMYFNKRHDRTGALFQGKYKAGHANTDSYLRYLVSYIHLNPIKLIDSRWKEVGIKDHRKAENYLADFRYSSYLDYLNQDRVENVVINKMALPKYFDGAGSFKDLVTEWLKWRRSNLGQKK